jgi:hypothetical protein
MRSLRPSVAEAFEGWLKMASPADRQRFEAMSKTGITTKPVAPARSDSWSEDERSEGLSQGVDGG